VDSLSVKRRLSCILAADAVGYSSQMGRDEEGTVRVLSAHRAVIDGIIVFHDGRIVSTAGDSVLAEFASVVEAVRCAVEMQEAIKTRNDSLEAHRRMLFRVGINLGDVVVKDNNVLGDGVNVAARLETLAEPGGICVSSSVYDQITGKLDLGFLDIGQQVLKNISRPIHVYRVAGGSKPAHPTTRAARPRARVATYIGVAGAIGGIVIAALVALQAGWLHFAPADAIKSTAIASPAIAPQSDPPAKDGVTTVPQVELKASSAPVASKAKGNQGDAAAPLQSSSVAKTPRTISDGEVATRQSNASIVRAPTGPDAMRQQAQAEISRARAAALAGRVTTTMDGTDPAVARFRAPPTDATRLHSDSDPATAMRRGAGNQGLSYRY